MSTSTRSQRTHWVPLPQVDTVVINVVLEDRVLFVSTSGWDPKEEDEDFPRIAVDRDASFCPHAMSKPPNSGCFQVPDAVHDWRFKRSPLVNEGKGPVGFFASSNINLRPVPIPDAPEREAMPVGSLCLVHHESKPPLNEAEERMLKQFAMMAANQCASAPVIRIRRCLPVYVQSNSPSRRSGTG